MRDKILYMFNRGIGISKIAYLLNIPRSDVKQTLREQGYLNDQCAVCHKVRPPKLIKIRIGINRYTYLCKDCIRRFYDEINI